jgi:Arc/MetJ-type ribon-helix-helix transcriptional regulator
MSDANNNDNDTTQAAPPAVETLAITLASGLVARYRTLVEAGFYASFDEAVGEAMRGHIRDAIEASHHAITLRFEPGSADEREAGGADAERKRSTAADK